MKIAIMQPYFLPYIGYYQLIRAADLFVIYDNIEYTKKGWINRNRILLGERAHIITLPLKKDSDYKFIKDRYLSDTFNKIKLKSQIYNAYKNSPMFDVVFPLIEEIIDFDNNNLFDFIFNSIMSICAYLRILTPLIVSSTIPLECNLKSQERVMRICKKLGASQYMNPVGGKYLYSKKEFADEGIDLCFLQPNHIQYHQHSNNFIPRLSIIDVMMFNDIGMIQKYLTEYELI